MVYDGQRDVFVFYGGPSGGETWEGDGVRWTQRSSQGPGPRLYFTMVQDVHRGVTVLFGGLQLAEDGGAPLADTWEWDGQAWKKRGDDGPRPRCCYAMAFDAARGVTVLFGGHVANGDLMSDTWEWDGGRWSYQGDHGPSPRVAHGMAYDRRRERVVLIGGIDRRGVDTYQTGTWEWDGWEWSRASAADPPPRYGQMTYYDDRRGVTVILGGNAPEDRPLSDAWEWNGERWTQSPRHFDLPDLDLTQVVLDTRRNELVCFEKPSAAVNIIGPMRELTDAGWILRKPATAPE